MNGEFIRDHAKLRIESHPDLARVTQLGLRAAGEAIASAGWTSSELHDDTTALVVGTSKGPIERWMTAPPVEPYRTNQICANPMGLHEIAESLARELWLGH